MSVVKEEQSLREEIVHILAGRYPHYFINKDVDEILLKIEKRIDSKIKQIQERGLYYDDMKTRGLQEFKKELLK